MKAPHLLRVEESPERYAELIAAVQAAGMRVGWLELGQGGEPAASEQPGAEAFAAPEPGAEVLAAPEPGAKAFAASETGAKAFAPGAPPDLERAAAMGCLRAVAAGAGRTVAVKPLSGPPVLRDLLREHFLGCRLVLVRGAADAPLLTPAAGAAWAVTPTAGAARSYTMDELAAALRKPRPWE